MKKHVSRLVSAAVMLAGFDVYADYELWQSKKGDADWSAKATWEGTRNDVPIDGEDVYFRPTEMPAAATNTIQLTEDVTTAITQWRIEYYDTNPGAVAFDGNGCTLKTPDFAEGGLYPSGHARRFWMGSSTYGCLLSVENNVDATRANEGYLRMENPYFVFRQRADGPYDLDFSRGVYDFYTPDGTARVRDFVAGDSKSAGCDVTFRGEGTKLTVGNAALRFNGGYGRFALTDGAEMTGNGTFSFYGTYSGERYFEVSRGASLVFNGGANFGWDQGHANIKPDTYHLRFEDANVVFTNAAANASVYCKGNGSIYASNSTFKASSALYLPTGITTQNVVLADSTFSSGTFYLGVLDHTASWKCATTSLVDGCTFTATAGSACGACTGVMRDTVINGPSGYILSIGPDSDWTFEDVTVNNFYISVGYYSQQFNAGNLTKLRIRNGTTRTNQMKMGGNYQAELHVSDNGVLQLDSAYGLRLCAPHADATAAYFPNCTNATAYLEEGGTMLLRAVSSGPGATVMNQGGHGRSKFVGDGGVLKLSANIGTASEFVHDLESCTATAKGLIVDSNGYSCGWRQDVTDEGGDSGRFVKRGTGTLQVTSSVLSQAETVVEAGTFNLANAAEIAGRLVVRPGATVNVMSGATLSGDLVLTNGASITIATGATVNLASLTVDDGTIYLDPSVTISVSGTVALDRLVVSFTSEPTTDQAASVLSVAGNAPQAVIDAWRDAAMANKFSDGTYVHLETVYDSGSDRTVFKATRKHEADPISSGANKVWTGSGAWSTAGNWSPSGAPTAANRAVFSSESAGSAVTLGEGCETGALEFDAALGYTLIGQVLRFTSGQGEAAIDVKQGAHEIAAPVRLYQRLDTTVDTGASLTVSGAVTGGSLKKTGKGALVLSGANRFKDGVSLSGGRNTVTGSGSVASSGGDAVNVVRLGNDTFELDASASAAFDSAISFEGEDDDYPVVVKNDGDMTAKVVGSTGGSFLKHGAGELTLDFTGVGAATFPKGKGGVVNGAVPVARSPLLTLPANGVIPDTSTNCIWGYTVASGRLVIKGTSSDTITIPGHGFIGSEFGDWSAQPELVIDGARVLQNSTHLQIGYNAGSNGRPRYPRLCLLNGAFFQLNTLKVGNGCWSGNTQPNVIIATTNSTFWMSSAGGSCVALPRPASNGKAVWRCKDSLFRFRDMLIQGGIDADFDHCGMSQWWDDGSKCGASEFAYGTVLMRNGTVFYCRVFNLNFDKKATPTATAGLKFVWDDARLAHNSPSAQQDERLYDESTGSNPCDLVLDSSCCNTNLVSFEFRAGGMTVATPANKTLTLGIPLRGEGGITQYGAGTTIIKDGAWQFTGLMDLAGGGTLDVTAHGGVIDNAFVGGSGTVSGGTFNNVKIACEVTDGWVKQGDTPVFSGSVLTGRLSVDFCRTAGNPLALPTPGEIAAMEPIHLATLSSGCDVSALAAGVRVYGTGGEKLHGKVTIENNRIYFKPAGQPGTVLIFR